MNPQSQTATRIKLIAIVLVCAIPSCSEAAAILWGQLHGLTGKALRDGLDFWAGGYLALHGHAAMLVSPAAYQAFLAGLYGKLPYHLWSYPPNYLLVAAGFGWLAPWHAVLAFDLISWLVLAGVLRLAGKSWWFTAAVLASPASLENVLEHQNAALMTAFIGGGLLLLATRPRLGGALIGLATIKPQLGLVLPLYLLRRAPVAVLFAAISAVLLAGASWLAFGTAAWAGFWHFTSPAMTNVLLTGQPADFANGLVSVFATAKPYLGIHGALIAQGLASLIAIVLAAQARTPDRVLILAALASPYLHDYDLLGAALVVALLTEERLRNGFMPGEPVLFLVAWFGPGLLPWMARFAHAVPLVLIMLLASAVRRGGLMPCDSSQVPPGSPESLAGRSPIPAPRESTAPG